MSTITLKEYIVSQNYRRQVENSNKKLIKETEDYRFANSQQNEKKLLRSLNPGAYAKIITKKSQNLKCFARSVIKNDADFVAIIKLIKQFQEICLKQIQTERDNQQLIKSIISTGLSKSKRSNFSLLSPSSKDEVNQEITPIKNPITIQSNRLAVNIAENLNTDKIFHKQFCLQKQYDEQVLTQKDNNLTQNTPSILMNKQWRQTSSTFFKNTAQQSQTTNNFRPITLVNKKPSRNNKMNSVRFAQTCEGFGSGKLILDTIN